MSQTEFQKKGPARAYSHFDAMSTEELAVFLHADSMEEEGADPEALLYAAELLLTRQQAAGTETLPNLERAWGQFWEHYLPSEDGVSLYEFEEDLEPKKAAKKVIRLFHRKWVALIAAVVVLAAGLITAYAVEPEAFRFLAQWTEEHFRFEPAENAITEAWSEDYEEKLAAVGINPTVAPSWVPDNYTPTVTKVTDLKSSVDIWCEFEAEAGTYISITLSVYRDQTKMEDAWFEKDTTPVEVYDSNGHTVYLFRNLAVRNAVFLVDDTIVLVYTDDPQVDLGKIIDNMTGGRS